MSYTLNIPDTIYDRIKQLAETTEKPIDQILLDHLATLTLLPVDEQAELNALRHLSDDTLWTIAAEQMSQSVQDRMQTLMDRNSQGTITPDERDELEKLVERGNRLMVRKAEAAGILMERGHTFKQENFKHKNE